MDAESKFALAEDLIEQFCIFLEKSGRSPVTVMNYRYDLKGLFRWARSRSWEPFDLRNFVANDLEIYREFLIREFKPKTTNRKLATLKIFLSWACAPLGIKELPRIPNVKLVPKERSQPSYLSPSEQTRLLHTVATRGTAIHAAVISLMLNTGIRVSELCALKWEDVKISDEEATVKLYSSKQKRHVEVPLNRAAREALVALGPPNKSQISETLLTGPSGPMTRSGVSTILNRYFKLAKLKNWTPTMLRHTFGMNLVRANVSPEIISKLMAHRSPEMTLAYYAPPKPDLITAEERLAVERLA